MLKPRKMTEQEKAIARALYDTGWRFYGNDMSVFYTTLDARLRTSQWSLIAWWLKRQAAQDASRCKPKHRKVT